MPVHTPQSLPPLRPCLNAHFRQVWGCKCTLRLAPTDLGFSNPRIIPTNPASRDAVCFAINSTTSSSRVAISQTSLPTPKCQRQLPRQYASPTSPFLIFRLVVLVHASLKIAQPLENKLTSPWPCACLTQKCSLVLTFTPLSRTLCKIRTQNRIVCV
jgi:hypothetical protein